ncbi:NAD(P)-dependent alcohol dehydrogenase [Saccharopolyspora indica]|uniref:zinc-dependent alcohol dehydrogenase family protein n=1 Tax=Saccharopolyspora indica TaxID=1229659 RepID=UPI0022EA4A02|nr:NAD(P)-dependent alcohol dehydrogenase [Saccharopolyspora indica]MDA3647028.1 NAD(P)-dependent alcohol dehydrogenase [Saccharopolyspora indica]
MRYFSLSEFTGAAGLRRGDREPPRPGLRQVLVRLRAWSLNHRDLLIAENRYGPEVRPGVVPLSDGAGEVVEVGAEVSRWRTGDRVIGIFLPNWISGEARAESFAAALGGSADGVLTEYAVFDEQALVAAPEHLSFAEAATLPCAAVTAWQAVVEVGGGRPGQQVLTLGSGGVSVFAVQLARALGVRVVATSSSDEKLARLAELGAAELVNYREVPEWGKDVAARTGGGVDNVIEVGGAGTLPQSLRAVRPGGRISVIGVLEAGPGISPVPLLRKALRLQGVYVGSREMFEALNRTLVQHRLHPVVDRVFPFSEAEQAYRYFATQQHFGKVVIVEDGP